MTLGRIVLQQIQTKFKATRIDVLFCFESLSSAAVSKDAGLICGGFEDSSIVLWSLTPKKLVQPKSQPEISKIQLSPGK